MRRSGKHRAISIGSYAGGAVAGAIAAATAFHLLAALVWPIPVALVGLVAAATIVNSGRLIRGRIRRRPFRVPQSWRRLGETRYAAIFGLMLGSALATEVPSGLYVLLAWSAAAPTLQQALAVALAFGVCRALPLVALGVTTSADEDRLFGSMHRIETIATGLVPVQLFVLSAIAVSFTVG